MDLKSILRQVVIEPIKDFHCLSDFHSGIETMDTFIHGDFQLSVENHYCSAYSVKHHDEIIAIFQEARQRYPLECISPYMH